MTPTSFEKAVLSGDGKTVTVIFSRYIAPVAEHTEVSAVLRCTLCGDDLTGWDLDELSRNDTAMPDFAAEAIDRHQPVCAAQKPPYLTAYTPSLSR